MFGHFFLEEYGNTLVKLPSFKNVLGYQLNSVFHTTYTYYNVSDDSSVLPIVNGKLVQIKLVPYTLDTLPKPSELIGRITFEGNSGFEYRITGITEKGFIMSPVDTTLPEINCTFKQAFECFSYIGQEI